MIKKYDVGKELLKLGIPAHVKGFKYLVSAVTAVAKDYSLTDRVTKELYPKLAAEFDSTPSRVERAIRHAIEAAFNNPDVADVMVRTFGRTCDPSKGKLTNSAFIAGLAWHVQFGKEVK